MKENGRRGLEAEVSQKSPLIDSSSASSLLPCGQVVHGSCASHRGAGMSSSARLLFLEHKYMVLSLKPLVLIKDGLWLYMLNSLLTDSKVLQADIMRGNVSNTWDFSWHKSWKLYLFCVCFCIFKNTGLYRYAIIWYCWKFLMQHRQWFLCFITLKTKRKRRSGSNCL